MSYYKTLLAFGLVAGLAGCFSSQAQQEEIVFVEPEPVAAEPVFTGKYK